MPTPAVDINVVVSNGSFTRTTYTKSTGNSVTTTVNTAPPLSRVRETRPISHGVPLWNGWRECASWSHFGNSARIGGASFRWETATQIITVDGNIFQLSDGLATLWGRGVSSNTRNKSLNQTLAKIKAQQVNLSVFMAELGKSARMVDGTLASIAGQIVSFRRRFPRDWDKVRLWQRGGLPRHLWCNIPSRWLELQYGWKPLMSDITGIINSVARKELPTVSAHSTAELYDESVARVSFNSGVGIGMSKPPEIIYKIKERSTTYLYYVLNDLNSKTSDQLGLANPSELVWEVLPYSFVIDWALPIGEWIGNLTADRGLSFRGGGQSNKVEVRGGGGRSGVASGGLRVPPPEWDGQGNYFSRQCYSSPPVPGVYVKNPLSLMHLANGLSLLATSMSR